MHWYDYPIRCVPHKGGSETYFNGTISLGVAAQDRAHGGDSTGREGNAVDTNDSVQLPLHCAIR